MMKVACVERTIPRDQFAVGVFTAQRWVAASAPHRNIETFMDACLIPVERNGDCYLSAQPENARKVRGHPPDAGEIIPASLPSEPWRGSVCRTDVKYHSNWPDGHQTIFIRAE
jgi:hypothetical protein